MEIPYLRVTAFHVRRLPHYYCVDHPIFLTWRLFGSLPPGRSFSPCIVSGQVADGKLRSASGHSFVTAESSAGQGNGRTAVSS